MSDLLDDDEVDDAYVLVRWLHELAGDPNPAVVASLEQVAEDRGWHPYDAWQTLVGRARGGIIRGFNPDLHPRGKDGQFIETGGTIRLTGEITAPNGKKIDATGVRGQVDAIIPDPANPGRPTIRVRVASPDGKRMTAVDVKPDQVEAAPEKARLDRPEPGLVPLRDQPREPSPRAPQAPKRLAPFDPNQAHVAQFEGGNPLSPNGNDDFGRGAAKLLTDDELDQVIAMREQDVKDKRGLSPQYDLKVLQAEKDSRGGGAPAAPVQPTTPKIPTKFDPAGDHIAQFTGGNPFSPTGNDDFGRAAAKLLTDDELDQVIAMRQQDVRDKRGLSPEMDLKMLQAEKASRGGQRLPDEAFSYRPPPSGIKPVTELIRGRPVPPPPETPEARERRLAAEEVRGATDEELARQRTLGPEVWQRAVAQEQENRAKRRARDAGSRQQLIADVNTAAADLSITDPEERAKGLDKILAKLRFSIIDTDKVHDHIYPPNESGRWTPERAAQHEAMWDDLLSQVEAAGIPQDRDALVLGGLPGAGKSFMLRPGGKADKFGVVSWEPNSELPEGATHVSVNPDIVKEMLIARGMLPEGISPDLKPMEQVTFLHEESSYVAKLFSQRLGDLGYNVVLDNTMDSEGGMLKRMTPLARQGYKFRGLFADIPQEESLESARKRYIDAALTPLGGRFVPSSVQGNRKSSKGNLSKNRDAMDTLVADDWFTEWMIVDNTGVSQRTPKGEIVGQGTGGGTAADRYRPEGDAALPKQGPRLPTPPEPAPTIQVAPAGEVSTPAPAPGGV